MHSEHCQSQMSVSSLNGRDGYKELFITSFPFFSLKNKGRATRIFLLILFFFKDILGKH